MTAPVEASPHLDPAPMRPLGRLGRHESKDEIVAMVSEESYMAELRLLTGDQARPSTPVPSRSSRLPSACSSVPVVRARVCVMEGANTGANLA